MMDSRPKLFRVLIVSPNKRLAYLVVASKMGGAAARVVDRVSVCAQDQIGVQLIFNIPIEFDRETIVTEAIYNLEWETSAKWIRVE